MADIAKHLLIALKGAGGFVAEVDPASVRLSPGLKQEIEAAGSLYPQIAINVTSEPMVEFTTYDIKFIATLTALSVAAPISLHFRALTDTFGYGTGYISMVMSYGMLEPVSISARRGQRAGLKIRVHLSSTDGDTSPVVVGTTTSGTVDAPTDFYCPGVLTLGTAIAGLTDATFNFGFSLKKNTGENGFPYPTLIYGDGQAASFAASSEALAYATQARMMQGTNETTITMAFRKLNTAGVPTASGGYLITASKAAISISGVNAARPATLEIAAACVATDVAGTSYLAMTNVA